MTPLQARILAGMEDDRLLDHIETLRGFRRLSSGEVQTLTMALERLDRITKPGDGREGK